MMRSLASELAMISDGAEIRNSYIKAFSAEFHVMRSSKSELRVGFGGHANALLAVEDRRGVTTPLLPKVISRSARQDIALCMKLCYDRCVNWYCTT